MSSIVPYDTNTWMRIIHTAVCEMPHPGPPAYHQFQMTGVMALVTFNPEIKLVFIQKADVKGYPWANQMAFPGGHKDKNDVTTEQTALRELREEMDINPENVKMLGSLGHFQTINNKDIEAFVGFWNEKEDIHHDITEISRVFCIPLSYLISVHKENNYHQQPVNVLELSYPFEDVVIWGATAKILHHFIESLLAVMNNE